MQYFLYKGSKSQDSNSNYCWYLFYNPVHRSNFYNVYNNEITNACGPMIDGVVTVLTDHTARGCYNDTGSSATSINTNKYIENYCNVLKYNDIPNSKTYFFDPVCSCMAPLYNSGKDDKGLIGPKKTSDQSTKMLYSNYNVIYGDNTTSYNETDKLNTNIESQITKNNFEYCLAPACMVDSGAFSPESFMDLVKKRRLCANEAVNISICQTTLSSAGDLNLNDTYLGTTCGGGTSGGGTDIGTGGGTDITSVKSYNCLNNSCVHPSDNTGRYASLSECESACSQTNAISANPSNYACDVNAGACVNNNLGAYASQTDCRQSGCEGGDKVKYSCILNKCVLNSTGNFNGLNACKQSCGAETPAPASAPKSKSNTTTIIIISSVVFIVIFCIGFVMYLKLKKK